jgi:hypothetical protein
LPKLTSAATTIITPKKRRMGSVLDAILKSTKMPTPVTTEASDDKIEDVREVAAASASSIHIKARPLGATPTELVKEIFPKKTPHHLLPRHLPRVIWTIMFDMLRESDYQKSRLLKCNIMPRT